MVLSVVDALYQHDSPTIDQLGGEQAIYAERSALAGTSSVHRVVGALCDEWCTLEDQDSATSFLIGIVEEVTPFAAHSVFDVILDSELVLPDIAEQFEAALRGRLTDRPLVRDFALEAWTRLALGKWATRTNHLRAALEDSGEFSEVTVPLVRALGAAVAFWRDDSLQRALESLASHEDVYSDAAMELGLYAIAQAVRQPDLDDVKNGLRCARHWFSVASGDEARPDAVAFDDVLAGLIEQTGGMPLTAARFRAIRNSVFTYLDGYLGADRGWRFARAQTSVAWADLLEHLHSAESDDWYDPAGTIESLARAITAETTMVLVVRSEEGPSQRGVRALVQSEVRRIGGENNAVLNHIRRWIEHSHGEQEAPLRDAVDQLLKEMESVSPKKATGESMPQIGTIRDHLNLSSEQVAVLESAAAATPEVLSVFALASTYSNPPRYADEKLLNRLLEECDRTVIGGVGAFTVELRLVLNALVRFGAFHLNEAQGGDRSAPWFATQKPWPQEHELADDLNRALCMSGLNSTVEKTNVAGGRVDIAISFQRCSIYIEVKRTDREQSDTDLVESYGEQAAQYASTDVPIAFLVVADYFRRRARLDLNGAFHVAPLQTQERSRLYALTTFRAQANVAPPSATSRKRI